MNSAFLQSFFFQGVKVNPQKRWQQRAEVLGTIHYSNVLRENCPLRVLELEPEVPSCSCMHDSVVVFAHPISKKAKYFFTDSPRARLYLQCACPVVAFDFNGFGESGSKDLFYWKDARAVIAYVQQKYPGKKIILHGTSFGAFHIIRTIPLLPKGSEVVLENVNKSLLSYWQRWPKTRMMVRLLELFRVRSIQDMNVQDVVKNFSRDDIAIKFIACEKDDMTTVAEMRELFALFNTQNKQFSEVKGAGHLAAPAKAPELYKDVLISGGCTLC